MAKKINRGGRCEGPGVINGKPMAHWQRMGKELLVDSLVRAAVNYGWGMDPKFQSIPQKLAAERLMELANAEDPGLVKELLAERDRCLNNLALFVADFANTDTAGRQKRKGK